MANTLQDQGFRFVARDRGYTWVHPLEVRASDVDCTDLDDDAFESFVARSEVAPVLTPEVLREAGLL